MLRNTNVLVAKVGFDTAENGPSKIWGNYSLPPTSLDGGPLFGRSSQGGVPRPVEDICRQTRSTEARASEESGVCEVEAADRRPSMRVDAR